MFHALERRRSWGRGEPVCVCVSECGVSVKHCASDKEPGCVTVSSGLMVELLFF